MHKNRAIINPSQSLIALQKLGKTLEEIYLMSKPIKTSLINLIKTNKTMMLVLKFLVLFPRANFSYSSKVLKKNL